MADYQLQPNEAVLLRNTRISSSGVFAGYGDELLLTNKNIIHIKKGTFGGKKAVNKTPLKSIKVYEDRAQVFFDKNDQNRCPELKIYLKNGEELTYQFSIEARREAIRWANEINKEVTGDSFNNIYDESRSQGVKGLAIDLLKTAIGVEEKPIQTVRSTREIKHATRSCRGCGAPISGAVGQVVRCEYCDLEQVVEE